MLFCSLSSFYAACVFSTNSSLRGPSSPVQTLLCRGSSVIPRTCCPVTYSSKTPCYCSLRRADGGIAGLAALLQGIFVTSAWVTRGGAGNTNVPREEAAFCGPSENDFGSQGGRCYFNNLFIKQPGLPKLKSDVPKCTLQLQYTRSLCCIITINLILFKKHYLSLNI